MGRLAPVKRLVEPMVSVARKDINKTDVAAELVAEKENVSPKKLMNQVRDPKNQRTQRRPLNSQVSYLLYKNLYLNFMENIPYIQKLFNPWQFQLNDLFCT